MMCVSRACTERMCCITQALCCSKRTSFMMHRSRFIKAPGRPDWGALERLVVLLAPSFRASRGASNARAAFPKVPAHHSWL